MWRRSELHTDASPLRDNRTRRRVATLTTSETGSQEEVRLVNGTGALTPGKARQLNSVMSRGTATASRTRAPACFTDARLPFSTGQNQGRRDRLSATPIWQPSNPKDRRRRYRRNQLGTGPQTRPALVGAS